MAEMILYDRLAIDDDMKEWFSGSFSEKCNCLPACTSIAYLADIDRAKLNFVEAAKSRTHSFFQKKG